MDGHVNGWTSLDNANIITVSLSTAAAVGDAIHTADGFINETINVTVWAGNSVRLQPAHIRNDDQLLSQRAGVNSCENEDDEENGDSG